MPFKKKKGRHYTNMTFDDVVNKKFVEEYLGKEQKNVIEEYLKSVMAEIERTSRQHMERKMRFLPRPFPPFKATPEDFTREEFEKEFKEFKEMVEKTSNEFEGVVPKTMSFGTTYRPEGLFESGLRDYQDALEQALRDRYEAGEERPQAKAFPVPGKDELQVVVHFGPRILMRMYIDGLELQVRYGMGAEKFANHELAKDLMTRGNAPLNTAVACLQPETVKQERKKQKELEADKYDVPIVYKAKRMYGKLKGVKNE